MKIIDIVLSGVQKIEDAVKIVKAVLAGLDAFTSTLRSFETKEPTAQVDNE